ncbi:hypothetical protein PPYR_00970 [Photinus pyralis]|uniref:Ig-like domain-containing protein n=1 Tax=Photinus pyralis TaxID=7054 RepID=A0A5N4B3P8_PHOPY|nr:uncharacterized protein LOC116159757 isoform X1 [Photinus pyralis]KAB0804000.1 hypothetical protein PPYR_00970 [Photinus pyralis]
MEIFRTLGFILLLDIVFINDSKALKDVSVIVPQAVVVGDSVSLHCRFNLEGEPLYTVKWYKGQSEFYRYLPKELPNTQVFPLSGIAVDLSNSSPNQVVLRDVQTISTGRYRCEVSTDAPNFFTNIETGYMYVIKMPSGTPQIKIEKDSYEVGYTLSGNCSSPPAYPHFNLTWFINDKMVNATSVMYLPDPNASESQRMPKITVARFELEIDANTFYEGKVRLQCLASLFNIYQSQTEVILEEERPKPRPSSVLGTRSNVAGLVTNSRRACLMSIVLLGLILR